MMSGIHDIGLRPFADTLALINHYKQLDAASP